MNSVNYTACPDKEYDDHGTHDAVTSAPPPSNVDEVKIMYTHEKAKLVHFNIPSRSSTPLKFACTTGEVLLGSGFVRLYQAKSTGVIYLKIGAIQYPLLRSLRVWRVGQRFIFPVPSGGYWRLEVISLDDNAADSLQLVLNNLVRFQRDPLPFDRHLLVIEKAANKLLGSIGRSRSANSVLVLPPHWSDDGPTRQAASNHVMSNEPNTDLIETFPCTDPVDNNPRKQTRLDNPLFDPDGSVPVMRFTPETLERLLQHAADANRRELDHEYRRTDHDAQSINSRNHTAASLSSKMLDQLANLFSTDTQPVLTQPRKGFCGTSSESARDSRRQSKKVPAQPLGYLFCEDWRPEAGYSQSLKLNLKSPQLPGLSTESMDEDDWDVVLDEFDAKNIELAMRLEAFKKCIDLPKSPSLSPTASTADAEHSSSKSWSVLQIEICQFAIGLFALYSIGAIAITALNTDTFYVS